MGKQTKSLDQPRSSPGSRPRPGDPRPLGARGGPQPGPGSVCKQTDHVAPAARSPPPVPAAPPPRPGATPAPDPTSAAQAGGCRARSEGAGPPGPRGEVGGGTGTGVPRPKRAPRADSTPHAHARHARVSLTRQPAAPSGPRRARLRGDAQQRRTARPDPGPRARS
ncbi:unnamed protein product [Rangifer tarandus platyrhynchus]|uniref:Uncharacterized protein n=1 Tax=Rangifer tarandus platyrhynchus TaxID=3082113 RepID=A0ABN8YPN0_RANTA|nr:unnamed protein product [Rangifer tarandus platyrhynchus]